jgi:hypothetical protein
MLACSVARLQIVADLLRGDTSMYDEEGFIIRSTGGFVNVLPTPSDLQRMHDEEQRKVCADLAAPPLLPHVCFTFRGLLRVIVRRRLRRHMRIAVGSLNCPSQRSARFTTLHTKPCRLTRRMAHFHLETTPPPDTHLLLVALTPRTRVSGRRSLPFIRAFPLRVVQVSAVVSP